MRRTLVLVALVGILVAAAPARAAAPDTITWLSRVGLNGAGSNAGDRCPGDGVGRRDRVSYSRRTPPTSAAPPGRPRLVKGYLRDPRTGVTTLVTGPENQPATVANDSMRTRDLVISGDGRWIAFGSFADNLIPGFADGNGGAPPTSTCTRSRRAI